MELAIIEAVEVAEADVYLLTESYDMHITIATWEGQKNNSRGLLWAL